MLSQSVITATHQPVASSGSNKYYAGNRAANNLPVRSQMSLTGSKMMGDKQRFVISRKVPLGRTGNSNGLMIKAAAGYQGQSENFFSKMGEKLNNAIDSVGLEASHMINPQSTQYVQLATGMGSIPAENPINPNAMKFQQIQNSLPQNTNMLSQIKKGKYAKAGGTTPRTRTVTRFTPIFFDIPSKEDEIDDNFQVNAIDQKTVNEDYFLDDYWDTQPGEPPKSRPKSKKGNEKKPKVVILGIGQGGYNFGIKISKDSYDVTLISPSYHFLHLKLPRAFLSTLSLGGNTVEDLNYRQAQCQTIDFINKKILVKDLSSSVDSAELADIELDYDYLIIACGMTNQTVNTPGLKDFRLSVQDPEGRILIDDKLQVANFPGVYAIGENAVNENSSVPFSAQVAHQQADYLATKIFNEDKMEVDGSPDFEYLHEDSKPTAVMDGTEE